MKRRFRLTRTTEFQRVRRFGKSYAHPLLVLITLKSEQTVVKAGIVAGRSIGNAVTRNRVKRQVRASLDGFIPLIAPGWDLVFLARKPVSRADFWDICNSIKGLLEQAGLLGKQN